MQGYHLYIYNMNYSLWFNELPFSKFYRLYTMNKMLLCAVVWYKYISKRNLPNVEMDGWMTKYTNKESTFHNIATFHTTIST